MGQVIKIAEATRVVAGDPSLIFIDDCYTRLAAVPGFVVREGQKDLSRAICRALVAGEPIAAEAPTGTGKTISYLIGALAATEKLRTTRDIPLIVATATVGLQSQILTGDLPRLFDAGILQEHDAVIAKGRGRYFCIANAERLVEGTDSTTQIDFFDEEKNVNAESLVEVREMLDAWNNQAWPGDSDSYTGTPPSQWIRVAANAETCLGHKCDHYNACPFFNARRALSSAKVVVANHDLVLSDLAMAKDGIDPLFAGGRYVVVFDEAHHLPDKALDIGSGKLDLTSILQELPKLAGYGRAWQKNGEFVRLLEKQKLNPRDFDPAFLFNGLAAVKDEVQKLEFDSETRQHRFPSGVVHPSLEAALNLALGHAVVLHKAMQEATQALKQSNLLEKQPTLKGAISDLLFQSAFFNSRLSKVIQALSLLTGLKRAVRWAYSFESAVTLHSSPLEGADVLKDLLWNSDRALVAMVSATLQDFDGFDRFKARTGVGDSLRTMSLPHIFPYRENKLYLVKMLNSPRREEKEAFQKELSACLPEFIRAEEGTLVLFPSRALMTVMLPVLRARFGSTVLCQGDMGIKELLKTHRARIDEGKGSLLCGLATLAEGLDLPGKYCTHVVICALPFSVPTSPVEQELQELLGKDYFAQRALPDTLVKLIQMVGRLMRRESDRGRITIFDKRLMFSGYGRKMLGALPNFKVVPVAPGDAPKT